MRSEYSRVLAALSPFLCVCVCILGAEGCRGRGQGQAQVRAKQELPLKVAHLKLFPRGCSCLASWVITQGTGRPA